MHWRNGLTGPKRGEIQLRPLLEAVLTSVCLSAQCRRPERLAALPQECCQRRQPVDLLHFRRKGSHVCFTRQAPCRVNRQLDRRPKCLDQRVPDEVCYKSMGHISMEYGSHQHGVWITSACSMNHISMECSRQIR